MSEPVQEQLKQAYELIRAQKRKEAIALLLPILRVDEDNANAWWLLANALDDPNDAREALQNVLRLRPDHDKARQMLERINQLHPPTPEPEPEPEPAEDVFDFDEPQDLADLMPGTSPAAGAGADLFGSARTSGPASDPFGSPAQTFGTPSGSRSAASDPFGGPAQSFGAPASGSTAGKRQPLAADDLFGSTASSAGEDPFGAPAATPRKRKDEGGLGAPAGAARAPRVTGKAGTNPLVIVLAVVGVVAICGCVACFAITQAGLFGIAAVGNVVVGTLEASGVEFQSLAQTLEANAPGIVETLQAQGIDINFSGDNSLLPSDAIAKGSIARGERKSDALRAGEQHTYTFSGNSGDTVTLELLATDSDFDPFLALYDPGNRQVASNDDFGGSLNSMLEFQLPQSGTYTVLVRGFADSSGRYELRFNFR